ncbi:mechanosensitive ion channel family protein [Natronococcus sp. JC468]|uniref:mechanosensitive ion channel family protein n=1 Tax=Natronococcus sp. JC468 TaxID=1961921 RepID=UPI00143B853B|nr:mechanosensitive ion channel family protein [Natronococcus sp. JC468]NKE38021.1 mechanosensitive ion channel family protein [Natronococcus sp. JC468]
MHALAFDLAATAPSVVSESIPNWLAATLVVLVAWYGSRLVTEASRPQLLERMQRRSVAEVLLRAVRAAVLVLAVFVVLGIYGVELSDLVLSATILSAVIGVTLAPVASDIVGGFFILANRPYEVNDIIELTDREESGYVVDVTLRYTKIRTLENTFLVVPNSTIRGRDVINLSADDERTRVSIPFLVTYEGDLEQAGLCSRMPPRGSTASLRAGRGSRWVGRSIPPSRGRSSNPSLTTVFGSSLTSGSNAPTCHG